MVTTYIVVKNELRQLLNHLSRTIRTPSLLIFYVIMILGTYFAMTVFAAIYSFATLIGGLSDLLKEFVEPAVVFSAMGLFTLSSVFSGYIGSGPSSSLETADEYVIMPAPVRPHQLLLGRYVRRLVRRISIAAIVLFTLAPVIMTDWPLFIPLLMFVLSTLLFFEFNHFLGGVTSQLKTRVNARTRSRLRYMTPFVVGVVMLLPTLGQVVPDPSIILIVPSNVFSMLVLGLAGIYYSGISEEVAMIFLIMGYFIGLLTLANLCDQSLYESFSAANSVKESESRVGRIIHGSVDFSDSRFSDPMAWIIVKDFWSRMRAPFQFWKYVYFAVGMSLVLWLNVAEPPWMAPVRIPPQLSVSAVPAFLIMLVVLCQISSMNAMVSFLDEKDNVYLLKASPFRRTDIVLAKYLGSLLEGTISFLPMLGLFVYFFHPQGSFVYLPLAIPLVILFNASGVMIGSYVPVLTNDPENAPIAMVFSFPTINLVMGAAIVIVVNTFLKTEFLLLVLPVVVTLLAALFLCLSVIALGSFK
ncbi:MAG: hypothetical protein C4K47_08935 [Candidatus Thorarchaeota archaeon]|nr:MAG: hypothetical protein C4K47_08935 [Candidatus Thorarchaeota archaeon]